jgi:hypothetical protein
LPSSLADFVRKWQTWVNGRNPIRPQRVDNSHFFCEHGIIVHVEKMEDLQDASFVVVDKDGWDKIARL